MGAKKGSPEETKAGSKIPKVEGKIPQPRLADLEKNGVFDREAILHYLANLARSGNGNEIFNDIHILNKGFTNSKSKIPNRLSEIDKDDKITVEDRHYLLIDEWRETLKAMPDSLLHVWTGWVTPGDSGIPPDQKPDWLDMDKLKRGQQFAKDNMFAVLYAVMEGSLPLYSFNDGLKPMIFTGNTTQPSVAFKRYLATLLKFRNWFSQDIWDKGTGAWKDMSYTRRVHAATRKRLAALTIEEIDAATVIPNAKCPAREIMLEDFREVCEPPAMGQCPMYLGEGHPLRPDGMHQTDMAITQWAFATLLVTYPERFGVHHATDEDLEAFCHLWRNIGYQLGIEDEYNYCRGTLEDIRKRSREVVEFWVKPNLREITPEWEHMTRSVVAEMTALVPWFTFEMGALHLMETLGLPMPRLYASFSYMDRIVYNLMAGLVHYGMKVPGVTSVVNKVGNLLLDRAANYTPAQLEALRIKLDG